ncbi:MAG: helix-turn-helix domain-containing protein [Lachnospiraceae bacterium]|nr:helix-turn-helix domain-containing protein [Lachnospiraceae bacterium]
MDNREIMQSSIDYIEENLKAEITVQELADRTGFSIFHYYRVFHSVLGMPVMQYILRRKLLHGIYEISKGNQMIDVAMQYGFDTYAGFYKAFKRELGYTPSEFLKKYKVKEPYHINLIKEETIMVTHKRITEILVNWGLQGETVQDIYYEDTGNHNENAYYVGTEYVIKFSPNLGRVIKHIELSEAITKAGLMGATVVKTQDGKDFVEEEALFFYLTKRISGKAMKASDIFQGNYSSDGRFIGEIIGQLHLALQEVDCEVKDVNLLESIQNWALPKAKEIVELSPVLCDEYTEVFGKVYDKLPKQIIHRDPNPGNIITSKDSWGFIDFELSERNIRIFDPCYAATAILSEGFDWNDEEKLGKWIEIYKNIIYGYSSVVNLSEEEMQAVPYVVLSNQLVCVAWLSEQDKYQDILEINKKMTKWMIDNFNELKF